jgi:2-dehydro-3-deoxyphosphooctonate aldolase (KDO 8-P synthase)
VLKRIKEELSVPVLSDVHSPEEVRLASRVLDVLQIPAFLCRQTDLVVAAARTGCVVNVKKGQFLSPWDVKNIVEKVKSVGNSRVLITERGFSFGYGNLVSDYAKSMPIIKAKTNGSTSGRRPSRNSSPRKSIPRCIIKRPVS